MPLWIPICFGIIVGVPIGIAALAAILASKFAGALAATVLGGGVWIWSPAEIGAWNWVPLAVFAAVFVGTVLTWIPFDPYKDETPFGNEQPK